jgi:hypothetical protein
VTTNFHELAASLPWAGSLLDLMPYRLTVNDRVALRGTLPEIRGHVAELVTARLAAAPDRVAMSAGQINAEWTSERVARELTEHKRWRGVLDPYGPDPLRMTITEEG